MPVSAKNTSSRLGVTMSIPAMGMFAGWSWVRVLRIESGSVQSGNRSCKESRAVVASGWNNDVAATRAERVGKLTRRWPDPIRRFSSSGVPSATIVPASMTAIWSASWSASSRYCVVRKIVIPLLASSWTIFHITARPRGSTPVVGSSRKTIAGCNMSDIARSSRLRMPPE